MGIVYFMKNIEAEFFGTAALLMVIVGSGIMGESLSQGNEGIALLANSIATGAGLFVLILCLGPISGAHLNPVVSLAEAIWGGLTRKSLFFYWAAQFSGAIVGVWVSHLMFNQVVIQVSTKNRSHPHLWFSELIATFGLVWVIALVGKTRASSVPAGVAAYITAAYWFTSSTAFANPAVSIARALTNTFCGIAPSGILPFVAAQVCGGLLAVGFVWRVRSSR